MRKYGTIAYRVTNRIICHEWREKAVALWMTSGDGLLNYRSAHVHAYIVDGGSHAGRPGCRV